MAADEVFHWCAALAELRRTLHNATWAVTIDDWNVPWNDATDSYELG